MPCKILVVWFCISLWSIAVFAADEGGGGIVYGSGIGILVSAPEGWMFDNESGVPQGLDAVMYPKGSTWRNAEVMIYVNTSKGGGESLDSFIAGEMESFKKISPEIKAEKAEPITLKDGVTADVRFFTGDKWGNFECIAYVTKSESVAIFVISSKNRDGLTKNIDVFRSMVSKSVLMDVEIQK